MARKARKKTAKKAETSTIESLWDQMQGAGNTEGLVLLRLQPSGQLQMHWNIDKTRVLGVLDIAHAHVMDNLSND